MFSRELGMVVTPLRFTARLGGLDLALAGIAPSVLLDSPTIFPAITSHCQRRCYHVLPGNIASSSFTRHVAGGATIYKHSGLANMYATIEAIVQSSEERAFIYAYFDELDTCQHLNGPGSAETTNLIEEIDRGYGNLLRALRGTGSLCIVTADHGAVRAEPDDSIRLQDYPDIEATLWLPLCGEPRFAYSYVRPDMGEHFQHLVETQLGDKFTLMRSETAVEAGLFGPANSAMHPRLMERIGDYVLIARGGAAISDQLSGEPLKFYRGLHGGLEADEMYIPLIVDAA